jgi:hypothetical protein
MDGTTEGVKIDATIRLSQRSFAKGYFGWRFLIHRRGQSSHKKRNNSQKSEDSTTHLERKGYERLKGDGDTFIAAPQLLLRGPHVISKGSKAMHAVGWLSAMVIFHRIS